MSTSPAPTTTRGDITLQPSYFTSSLYVLPLREDITALVGAFGELYAQTQPPSQPFALFKKLWVEQGWCWLHFKAFDGRARESFIAVTERVLLERLVETEHALARVVALFALYTFYFTQPSSSSPALHSVKHIAISIDLYKSVLALPTHLTDPYLLPLQPHVRHALASLLNAQAFQILPHSGTCPYNPSVLPREIFVADGQQDAVFAALAEGAPSTGSKPPKKKGRPSKREKMKRAKDALIALEKYVDKNTITLLPEDSNVSEQATPGSSTTPLDRAQTTHALIAQTPSTTRNNYRAQKAHLLGMLDPYPYGLSTDPNANAPVFEAGPGRRALERANEAVLARLKMIDAMAAEKGLEVGGEGGEKTGLARVERAVEQLKNAGPGLGGGGILGLLEGAG